MWHYFPRGPLENRVLKTRFIIQKNFKNLPSPKHSLTSPDRIRSERESDQREGDQIREREIVRSERERKRSRTWVAQPRCATSSSAFFFFFFSFWLWFLFWLVLFWYIWALNRVFKTRFSSGQHVENDATSDVIRPWKSSLKDSIYCSKSTLLYSNC